VQSPPITVLEVGNYVELIDISVKGAGGISFSDLNVIIAISPDSNSKNQESIIDITDLGDGKDALAVYSDRRIVKTNSAGIAQFTGPNSPTILNERG